MATDTAPLPHAEHKPSRPRPGSGWRVTGIVFVLLCALIGGYTLAAFAQTTYERQADAVTVPVTSLVVEGDNVSVSVTPTQAPRPITIDAMLHARPGDASWEQNISDGVLTVDGRCITRLIANFCSIHFDITVPAGVPVQVTTRTGDVLVDGLHGPADISTSTGDVDVTGATGRLRVRTSTGDITAEALDVEQAEVQASTGDIRLTHHRTPLAVQAGTSTGDIQIQVPDDGTEYRVQATASTGDITVDVPRADRATNRLTATTRTGDVTLR